MVGKIEGRRRKEVREDKMVGWHHNSMDISLSKLQEMEGQGSLACCSPWGGKELDMTEQLKNNNSQEE